MLHPSSFSKDHTADITQLKVNLRCLHWKASTCICVRSAVAGCTRGILLMHSTQCMGWRVKEEASGGGVNRKFWRREGEEVEELHPGRTMWRKQTPNDTRFFCQGRNQFTDRPHVHRGFTVTAKRPHWGRDSNLQVPQTRSVTFHHRSCPASEGNLMLMHFLRKPNADSRQIVRNTWKNWNDEMMKRVVLHLCHIRAHPVWKKPNLRQQWGSSRFLSALWLSDRQQRQRQNDRCIIIDSSALFNW